GRFAFLAFGVRRVPALSAFQTLADLPTRFSSASAAFRFRNFRFSASGPASLADPFSRLHRPRLINPAVPAACEPRVLLRISPVLDASTLAGFGGISEPHSRNVIPSNKWQHK
ncbi:hypothetical protein, partial [Embleya sp. NPDC059237]|uniref:hypothetical protein n=1 Tax=Embleya sp. NPDC059237 TaxID=3346784 RepID=UPI0036AA2A66